MPRVSFLIAGVQKAGTTALFDYLCEHPSLELPASKELHFFDDETVDWDRPDIARYEAQFSSPDRIWGEATPIYVYWPDAIERIARYNPRMKLIFLFRDPVERAWSHWKMEYAKGKERRPFSWCIREGRERLDDPANERNGYHRVFSYVERGFYGAQLARVLRSFDRKQLLFLRSEDLGGNPDPVIEKICDFLEVAPLGPIRPRLVHESRKIAYPSELTLEDREFLAGIYASEMDRFEQLSGLDAQAWRSAWVR